MTPYMTPYMTRYMTPCMTPNEWLPGHALADGQIDFEVVIDHTRQSYEAKCKLTFDLLFTNVCLL